MDASLILQSQGARSSRVVHLTHVVGTPCMWDTIPHVIDAIVNHERRPSLLNKSAIGFTQGNEPPTPDTFIAYQGAALTEVTT